MWRALPANKRKAAGCPAAFLKLTHRHASCPTLALTWRHWRGVSQLSTPCSTTPLEAVCRASLAASTGCPATASRTCSRTAESCALRATKAGDSSAMARGDNNREDRTNTLATPILFAASRVRRVCCVRCCRLEEDPERRNDRRDRSEHRRGEAGSRRRTRSRWKRLGKIV